MFGQSICCVDSCPFLRFRPAYVNTHLNWEDCLGYKLKLGKEGKTAFKFIEKAEAGDSKIDVSVAFLCGRAFTLECSGIFMFVVLSSSIHCRAPVGCVNNVFFVPRLFFRYHPC